jgi:hypothetical protein
MKFMSLSGIDPFSDKEDATNPIWIKPENIIQIEPYSGTFPLQAYGPDGRLMQTGKFKTIIGGSLVIIAPGGSRVISEPPAKVLEMLSSFFD